MREKKDWQRELVRLKPASKGLKLLQTPFSMLLLLDAEFSSQMKCRPFGMRVAHVRAQNQELTSAPA